MDKLQRISNDINKQFTLGLTLESIRAERDLYASWYTNGIIDQEERNHAFKIIAEYNRSIRR